MTTPNPAQILATPMVENDADTATIGGYLIRLLTNLWEEGEMFDAKRPFGDSDWDWDVLHALVAAGHIPGDADGPSDREAESVGRDMIDAAIRSLYPV